MEDIMSQQLDTFNDINGDRLFVGALVTSSQFQGQGEVAGYLSPDDGRNGALLRIKVLPRTSRSNTARGGQIVDMRVKLGGVVKVPPPPDPKARTTDQKYGI
jgi:hypothetical protein